MGKLQIAVAALLSFAGCQSQSQQASKGTAPTTTAATTQTAESADAPASVPSPIPAAHGAQVEWWCTVNEKRTNGFCNEDLQICEGFRSGMLNEQPPQAFAPCTKATGVACFHPSLPGSRVGRACSPTLTMCSTAREAMLKHDRAARAMDECAVASPAPPRPPPVADFAKSKAGITKIKLQKYAFEAFPEWAAAHPDKQCPDKLAELNEYTTDNDSNDAWGRPLKMLCGAALPAGAKGIGVVSMGADAKEGTDDDIKSWE
jgi:hypothetical protein